ncbi:hypothetical protein IT398_01715 [Candidatus Nomurabacteria bacterium]|nr:hypothetical protein [Candidatus Nomurabacteria bacterium]
MLQRGLFVLGAAVLCGGMMGTSCGVTPVGGFTSGQEGSCIVSPLGIVCWSDEGQTNGSGQHGPVVSGGTVGPDGSITVVADGSLMLDWSSFNFSSFWPSAVPPFRLEIEGPSGLVVIQPVSVGNGLVFIWTPNVSGTFTIWLVDRDGRRFQLPPIVIVVLGVEPPAPSVSPLALSLVTPSDGATLVSGTTQVPFTIAVSGGTGPYQFVFHFYDGQIIPSVGPTVYRSLVTTGGQLMSNLVRVTSSDGQVRDISFGIRVN